MCVPPRVCQEERVARVSSLTVVQRCQSSRERGRDREKSGEEGGGEGGSEHVWLIVCGAAETGLVAWCRLRWEGSQSPVA